MKHLKTYESKISIQCESPIGAQVSRDSFFNVYPHKLRDFKEGDYVKLKDYNWSCSRDAKIILKDNSSMGGPYIYKIETFSSDMPEIIFSVKDEEIERKLNKKEIEEFELRKSANQYNL